MKYKPSEVTILVHAGRPTSITADPPEIGTATDPLDEGVTVPIQATLKDNKNSPIQGKTLYLFDPNGAQLDSQVTDANGIANLTYVVNAEHDELLLIVSYLGD